MAKKKGGDYYSGVEGDIPNIFNKQAAKEVKQSVSDMSGEMKRLAANAGTFSKKTKTGWHDFFQVFKKDAKDFEQSSKTFEKSQERISKSMQNQSRRTKKTVEESSHHSSKASKSLETLEFVGKNLKEVLGDVAGSLAAMAPELAAIGGLAALAVGVVKGIFDIDDATKDLVRSLGSADDRITTFERSISTLVDETGLGIDQLRDLAHAGFDVGLSMTAIRDQMPEYARAVGDGVKMFDLSAESAIEYAKILHEQGMAFDAISDSIGTVYSDMTRLNLTIMDSNAAIGDASYAWKQYGGVIGMSADKFTSSFLESRAMFKSMNMDAKSTSEVLDRMFGSFDSRLKVARFIAARSGGDINQIMQQMRMSPEKTLERKYGAAMRQVLMMQGENAKFLGMPADQVPLGKEFAFQRANDLAEKFMGKFDMTHDEIQGVFRLMPKVIERGGLQNPAVIDELLPEIMKEFTHGAEAKSIKEGRAALRSTTGETMAEMGRQIGAFVHDISDYVRDYLPPLLEAVNGLLQIASFGRKSVNIPRAKSVGVKEVTEATKGALGMIVPGAIGGLQTFNNAVTNPLLAQGANQVHTGVKTVLGGGKTGGATNADKIRNAMSFFTSAGLPREAAAGIVGNFIAESGMASGVHERSGGGGFGLAQWTSAGRKAGLKKFAAMKGKDISDFGMQLEYALQEMKDQKLFEKLQTIGSLEAASNLIMLQYERPREQGIGAQRTRQGYSRNALGIFDAGGMVSAATPTPVVQPPTITKVAPPVSMAPPPRPGSFEEAYGEPTQLDKQVDLLNQLVHLAGQVVKIQGQNLNNQQREARKFNPGPTAYHEGRTMSNY